MTVQRGSWDDSPGHGRTGTVGGGPGGPGHWGAGAAGVEAGSEGRDVQSSSLPEATGRRFLSVETAGLSLPEWSVPPKTHSQPKQTHKPLLHQMQLFQERNNDKSFTSVFRTVNE